MSIRTIALATALIVAGTFGASAEDDGFATKSVTNMGLTGQSSSTGGGASTSTVGRPGPSTANGAGPVGSGTVSGSVGVGMGAGTPAPGGGTFGSPRR